MRLGRERDRELELALLAMAEFGDRHVGALGEANPGERGMRGLAQRASLPRIGPETVGVAGMRLRGQRDIVGGGEIAQQRGDLERARQPSPLRR